MSSERDPASMQLSIWLSWLVFFGWFAHGYLENTDSVVTLHGARAWLQRGEPGLLLDEADPLLLPAERAALLSSKQLLPGKNGEHYAQFAIGHQALMVPCVALGKLAARLWPSLAKRQAEVHRGDVVWGGHFWERFFCSLLPVPFAAGIALFVWRIARALCAARREALAVMLVTVLCTQLWPGCSETMSDVPGLCALLGVIDALVRYERGLGTAKALVGMGIWSGVAVLLRYPQALAVAVLVGYATVLALRRGRARDLVALAVGGAPFLAALLAANWLRFGNAFETGYSQGADETWWSMPWKWGIPLVLLSPCKGILVFSPPLWSAFAQKLPRPRGLVVALLLAALVPVLLVAHTWGWSGSQCWGIRYLTPSVVIAVVTMLALGKPWERWPRLFRVCIALGFCFQLGGVLAPYRGQQLLAEQAARVHWAHEIQSGVIPLRQLGDYYQTDLRFTPLWGHYAYALAAARGRLEGKELPGAMRTMFLGVEAPQEPAAPEYEDRGFRHVWPVYVAGLAGWSPWSLALPLAGISAALAWLTLRRLLAQEPGYESVAKS